MALRVLSDEQSQLYERQPGEQMIEPQLRAFTAWRQITVVSSARVAITHRDDRNTRLIVESLLADAHPGAQTLSARVVPGNAGGVHAQARRLPHYEDPGRRGGTQDRSRTERKVPFTCPAIADGYQQLIERRIFEMLQVCA